MLITKSALEGKVLQLDNCLSSAVHQDHNTLYSDKIFEIAWVASLITLIAGNLVDIQYFDGRISIAGWILLSGLRNVIKKEI